MRACAVPTQQNSCRSSTRIWKNSCWSLNVSVAVCCCMAATCDGVVVEWRRKRRQRSGERRRRAAAALLLRRASSARRSRLSLLAHDSCCKLSLRLSRRAPLPPCSRCVAAGAVCRAWGAPLTGRSRCVRTWSRQNSNCPCLPRPPNAAMLPAQRSASPSVPSALPFSCVLPVT